MKKFISLLIASAMVVSLVPATAFAGQSVSATAKVIGAKTLTETTTGEGTIEAEDAPELQITFASATYSGTDAKFENADLYEAAAVEAEDLEVVEEEVVEEEVVEEEVVEEEVEEEVDSVEAAFAEAPTMEFEITLDDAVFVDKDKSQLIAYIDGDEDNGAYAVAKVTDFDKDGDEAVITVYGKVFADDKLIIELAVDYDLDAGDYATVSVDSDAVEADDLTFLTISDTGIEASIKDLTTIAEDETGVLDYKLVIEETVSGTFDETDFLLFELSKGFEFMSLGGDDIASSTGVDTTTFKYDDEMAYIELDGSDDGKIVIYGLQIAVEGADEGDIATIEITAYSKDNTSSFSKQYSKDKIAECEIEVVEVCDYVVSISVDEDEDVPVFYSGVNSDNDGLNDDADHVSLEVTITESFATAWDDKEFELTLPEGVYVVGVEIEDDNINWIYDADDYDAYDDDAEVAFAKAYQEGDYESFVFEKRVFSENTLGEEAYEMVFTLTLTAEPDFEGEVVLGFIGDAVNEDEVVIAEFVAPFTATASQNDVIIDYRNTSIDTPIVITEAEAELWAEDLVFYLTMEDYIDFDDAGDISVNEDSGMELKTDNSDNSIDIKVDEESDDEAAVITIENIELYMNRSLAAGSYALDIKTSASYEFMSEAIFAPADFYELSGEDEGEGTGEYSTKVYYVGDLVDDTDYTKDSAGEGYEVHEAFVNIVTAGRDQDDTFATQIIVPIGEMYIFAGGKQIELDVPAYISADGYTMLPVRAVAEALGIASSNVLWNADARQVTIIYSSKTIAMVVGQSYMTVNGTAIPTDAAPEITDSRTFLSLRDLATALSITNINWDADTRTATLN